MKLEITTIFKTIIRDRYLAVLLSVFLLECLIVLLYIGLTVHPSELQVVVHYTSFGNTNFYRDKWYYLLSFGGFIIFVAALHLGLMYRLLQTKGRPLAIAFTWLGMLIVLIAAALFYQVLKIASLS